MGPVILKLEAPRGKVKEKMKENDKGSQQLHISPVLPAYLVQRMRDLSEGAIFHSLH